MLYRDESWSDRDTNTFRQGELGEAPAEPVCRVVTPKVKVGRLSSSLTLFEVASFQPRSGGST